MKHLLTLLFLICSIGRILGESNVSFNMNQFKIDKDVYCIYETMTSCNRSKSSTEYDFVIQDSSILQSQESLILPINYLIIILMLLQIMAHGIIR